MSLISVKVDFNFQHQILMRVIIEEGNYKSFKKKELSMILLMRRVLREFSAFSKFVLNHRYRRVEATLINRQVGRTIRLAMR